MDYDVNNFLEVFPYIPYQWKISSQLWELWLKKENLRIWSSKNNTSEDLTLKCSVTSPSGFIILNIFHSRS